jgi:hypothetical protein
LPEPQPVPEKKPDLPPIAPAPEPIIAPASPLAPPEPEGILAGPLSITATGSFKWHSPNLSIWEVGATLEWRRFFLTGAYGFPAKWDFAGRDIEVHALSFGAGWSPVILRPGGAVLSAVAAVAFDRLVLLRTDVAGATSHDQVDVGPQVGAEIAYVAAGWLHLSAGVAFVWFPTAHLVQVADGPSERLNDVCLAAHIRLGWSQ